MRRLNLLLLPLLFLGACSPTPNTPLKNTYWSLIELNGKDVIVYKHQPSMHLLFHINDSSMHGNDGCNRFQGDYIQTGGSFRFKQIATTRMACAEGMGQGAEFLETLHKTDRAEIQGKTLILFQEEQEIARFEANEDY